MKFGKIDLNLKRTLKRKRREARWAEEDGTAAPSRLTLLKENLSQFFHSRPFKIYLTAKLSVYLPLTGMSVCAPDITKKPCLQR